MAPVTSASTLVPTGTWAVDTAHSKAGFAVKHMGIATVRGEFTDFEGALEIGDDISTAEVHGKVKVASVDTSEEGRDGHLRSPDFFDAEQYPEIAFASKTIAPTGDDTFEIAGELSLHGIARELTLQAEITGTEEDPWGNDRVGLEVTGELDRGDYGITFNQAFGSGNVVVSDKVKLRIDVK